MSNHVLTARNQQITRKWWDMRRSHYDIHVSECVIMEVSAGNAEEAKRRLEILAPLPELKRCDRSLALAERLLKDCGLPARAATDASHVAIAAIHNMDFLLTWNCRHLANPKLVARMRDACQTGGYRCPNICTPEALLETAHHERTDT